MWGVTTQVSDLKISTACTTALKNKPDTLRAAPSRLRMCIILLQTALAWDKFITNTGQSSSSAESTRPRYLKEFTISRGRP